MEYTNYAITQTKLYTKKILNEYIIPEIKATKIDFSLDPINKLGNIRIKTPHIGSLGMIIEKTNDKFDIKDIKYQNPMFSFSYI